MSKPSLPFAGGLGAAAVLAFMLGPWSGQQNGGEPTVKSVSPKPDSPAVNSSSPQYALSENEQGPWYALCKVFSTIDPEDMEQNPDHETKPPAGLEIHPPLSSDAETRHEELKEETVVKKEKEADGEYATVQRKFNPRYHTKANLGTCLPAEASQPKWLTLRFMVATIPDPLGSHLALEFDRNVDSIERAAESQGFRFERYWFPWNGIVNLEQSRLSDSAADSLKQELREQPGLLIFRKSTKNGVYFAGRNGEDESPYSDRLVVFLVGETPTSGINKVAFSKAAVYVEQLRDRLKTGRCNTPPTSTISTEGHGADDETEALCKEPFTLPVLGPNFSGSFSTLYRTLHDLHRSGIVSKVNLISPTASVEKIIAGFKGELEKGGLGTFRRLSPVEKESAKVLLSHLNLLGYETQEIAYLSEDESSYSPGDPYNSDNLDTESPRSEITNSLKYPRDLSSLRNTWQPTSITITPADIAGEATTTRITPFSLHENASNELDSPSSFAKDQAAPDIDQALSSLIAIIRHRRFRVIIVTASNPLDEVYLLQYVHKNAPDVRLATFDQDFLMLRETNYDSLRGTISVTSFPLDSALLFDKTNLAQFPSSASEATYIGMRELLNEKFPPVAAVESSDPLTQGPGVYVLGDDGFWTSRQKAPLEPFKPDRLGVPWTWYILLAGLVAFAVFHLNHNGKTYMPHGRKPGSNMNLSFRRRIGLAGSRREEDLLQDYFLLIANNQIAILLFFASIPSIAVYRTFFGGPAERFAFFCKWSLFLSVLAMTVVMIAVSVLLSIRIKNSISRVIESNRAGQAMMVGKVDLVMAIVYAVVTMTIWCLVICFDGPNSEHAASRTIFVLDGLSPLPVAVSVIAVWYLFAVTGLRAVHLMKGMRVDPLFLASRAMSCCPEWIETLGVTQGRLIGEIENLVRMTPSRLGIMAICFCFLFALQGWPALRGIDNYWFRGWLVFGGVGLLTAAVAVQFFRLLAVWRCLRSLLSILDFSLLSPGFERIPAEMTPVKVWRPGQGRHSRELEKYTFELLRRIANRPASQLKGSIVPFCEAAEVHVQDLYLKLRWNEDTHLTEHKLLNACFDACMSPTIGEHEDWFQKRCEEGDALVIDFAALRYVALIRYANVQMRGLLSFVLYGYVFLLLGLQTYPFQGQHTIGSALTILFTVIFLCAGYMFIQMDSNPFLSKLERTAPNKADGFSVVWRLITVGGLPFVAVLASQFPAIERFLIAWVKPTLDSLH